MLICPSVDILIRGVSVLRCWYIDLRCWCIAVLIDRGVNISRCWYIAVLINWVVDVSRCWYIDSRCWCIAVLIDWFVDISRCWHIAVLIYRGVNLSRCWYIEVLTYPGVDISRCWYIEVLKYQDVDISRCWYIKVLIYPWHFYKYYRQFDTPLHFIFHNTLSSDITVSQLTKNHGPNQPCPRNNIYHPIPYTLDPSTPNFFFKIYIFVPITY